MISTFAGTISMLWVVLCLLLLHDTPAEHPGISMAEREYIEKSRMNFSGESTVSTAAEFFNYSFY